LEICNPIILELFAGKRVQGRRIPFIGLKIFHFSATFKTNIVQRSNIKFKKI